MFIDTDLPPGGERRQRRIRKLLALFERDEIEAAADALIALLDARDGDPDLEPDGDELDLSVVDFSRRDPAYRAEMVFATAALAYEDTEDDDPAETAGDELDGNASEDDFMLHGASGPGCPISDTDHGAEEAGAGGDPSWTEWHSRGRHKIGGFGSEVVGHDSEDVEDDDADTGIEDDPRGCDPESDSGVDDEPHDGDEDEPDDVASRAARRPHRDRIRRTRCERVEYPVNRWTGRQHVEYHLPDSRTHIGGIRVVGL